MMMIKNKKRTIKPPPARRRQDTSKGTVTNKDDLPSLQLSPDDTQQQQSSNKMRSSTAHTSQLNLFPLHPEHDHQNMANYFFSTADGGATSLTCILGLSPTTASSSSPEDHVIINNGSSSTTLSSSVSLSSYAAWDDEEEEGAALVRTAMRNKERDAGEEERWVSYSEVVEKRSDEEVTSCCVVVVDNDQQVQRRKLKLQSLSLKLDYQEILNAWSDRGPLYMHAESDPPQTVPDIYDDVLAHQTTTPFNNGTQDNNNTWSVPEMANAAEEGVENGGSSGCGKKGGGEREASVVRYREKRQNRLFAKRIRYQVRKLNAEKRPRVKGRFVKRS